VVFTFEEGRILFEKQLQKLPIKEVSPIQRSKAAGRWGTEKEQAQYTYHGLFSSTYFQVMVGFSTKESYNVPRSRNDVPDELIDAIFPWLAEYNWLGTAGLPMKKLFTYLAEVLAQDLPILFQKYPSHFLRFHPVFKTNVYCRYSRDVVSSTDALSDVRLMITGGSPLRRLFGRSGHKK
jgi:hypothetical protein